MYGSPGPTSQTTIIYSKTVFQLLANTEVREDEYKTNIFLGSWLGYSDFGKTKVARSFLVLINADNELHSLVDEGALYTVCRSTFLTVTGKKLYNYAPANICKVTERMGR